MSASIPIKDAEAPGSNKTQSAISPHREFAWQVPGFTWTRKPTSASYPTSYLTMRGLNGFPHAGPSVTRDDSACFCILFEIAAP